MKVESILVGLILLVATLYLHDALVLKKIRGEATACTLSCFQESEKMEQLKEPERFSKHSKEETYDRAIACQNWCISKFLWDGAK